MASTVENVRSYCKNNKIPISRLESDLGYGNGFLNPKKIKDIPAQRLAEIAHYLKVPIETFIDEFTVKELKDEKKPVTTTGDGLERRREMLFNLFDRLPENLQNSVIAQLQGLVQLQAVQDVHSKSE